MKLLHSLDQVSKFISSGKKMRDSIPIGFISGLMGTIAMDLSNLMFQKTGVSEKTYAELAGSILMRPFRLRLKENKILGQILHLITGSIIGIPLFTVLKKTGKDNYLFKGAIYGTFTWELLYSFGLRYNVFRSKAHSTSTHMTTLIDNLVYGFVSSATMIFLTDHAVLPKGSDKQLENQMEGEIPKVNDRIGDSFYNYEDEVRLH
ncbi:DUF6789 family protein [Desulfosporosinus nitroreducens]|uniref:DUF2938 domain-containing protein n=1 Tax=Desulfosporosinus nitroreducens TaxID=2018668 RepID=A0ABT8QS13_9FIRM|nr:DUF6789 family protein [Desulfosporosinus nitroreducens]MDO0822676.1 hypothetical protein [Desulfosporosinus nitroreducens]